METWYIYTEEYYIAMRNSKILPFATRWIDLEGIRLSELTEKDKFHVYYFCQKKMKLLETEIKNVAVRVWGWG